MKINVSLFTSPSKAGIALETLLQEKLALFLTCALQKAKQESRQASLSQLIGRPEPGIQADMANSIHTSAPQHDVVSPDALPLALTPVFTFIKRCASEGEFFKAQLENDLVIFDGSLEAETDFKLGDNYSPVGHAPYLLDNVIVVSRTVLPINYIPAETNVPPVGEESQVETEPGFFTAKKSYTNQEICRWMETTLYQWIKAGRLPRPDAYKRSVPPLEKLFDGSDNLAAVRWLIHEAVDISEKTQKYRLNPYAHTAFISYRSYYQANACHGFTVKELETYILDYHKQQNPGETWRVLYYPGGSLARDCMTEYRRWSLTTYVDNIFKNVPEVWIFDTPDPQAGPSYWDSWFTQAEIISLIMLNQGLSAYCPKIYLFDPSTSSHREISPEQLPTIQGENKDDWNIITANSEILYGDYSGLVGMQQLKQKSKATPYLLRKLFYKILSTQLGYNAEKSFRSHSYDASFMTTRIISCSHCVSTGHSLASFFDPAFIRRFLHIGSDDPQERAKIARYGYFSLSESDFRVALHTGKISCPHCRRTFGLKETGEYFYIWRHCFHNPSIDFDGYIEPIPLYHIEETEHIE